MGDIRTVRFEKYMFAKIIAMLGMDVAWNRGVLRPRKKVKPWAYMFVGSTHGYCVGHRTIVAYIKV